MRVSEEPHLPWGLEVRAFLQKVCQGVTRWVKPLNTTGNYIEMGDITVYIILALPDTDINVLDPISIHSSVLLNACLECIRTCCKAVSIVSWLRVVAAGDRFNSLCRV